MPQVCPNFLSTGSCPDSLCKLNHDIVLCKVCSVVCNSAEVYQAHLQGRKHRVRLNGASIQYHCPICKLNVVGVTDWEIHQQGKRHRRAAVLRGVSPNVDPEEAVPPPGAMWCSICNMNIPEKFWSTHPSSLRHKAKLKYAQYEAVIEEAMKDRHGIIVFHGDDDIDFGILETAAAHIGSSIAITIKNTVPSARITLVEAKFPSGQRNPSAFFIDQQATPQPVTYGRDVSLPIRFRQNYAGRYHGRIELTFEDTSLGSRFVIVRLLKATVGSSADYELLKPVAPYVPRKRVIRDPETEVVPGEPPETLRSVKYVVKLGHAKIPQWLSSLLSQGARSSVTARIRQSALPATLDSETHGRHFAVLLWTEEYQMDCDMETYDMHEATLNRHNSYYYLSVPGLAEKRPSVLVGDRISVQPHGDESGKWFEGYVHVVHREEVGLRFGGSFNGRNASQRYRVRFKLNRIPLRRQHQALGAAFHPNRLLFPAHEHMLASSLAAPTTLTVYNPLIASNPAQVRAVSRIIRQAAGSAPFVVFGPPGTGKTVTIVEAILQVLKHNPQARILATAPSNSAADLIASRLISQLSPEQMFRFYAPSRFKNQAPDELLDYAAVTPEGHFTAPPVFTLKRYRVVVTTCVSSSFAHNVGMPRGHFSHIFVDEAGQATEPEVMIPIRTMADNATNVILSGDPKQLGPIIRSPIARDLGMEESYIERLMKRVSYDELNPQSTLVVKLIKNFRSQPAILKYPNEKFYNGELQSCGDPQVINSFLRSPLLPNKKFPVIMHAITGKDDREASSPSFFNIDEVTLVKTYVQSLRADHRFRISGEEIGIIAPYNAQCRKIRMALKGVADEIKVGSVEEFQGQERRVIIISTVRSSREFVNYDLKHTLGFVANPRRFNVAVTRAKALLVVIGDPSVLSLDPLWRSFLNYVHVNGGWKGNPPTWDTSAPVDNSGDYMQEARETSIGDMNEFARRMEALTLQEAAAEDEDADANVDRPWREVE
ncbi:P-loop containing nucleoside triphosphate hydrolase protein [Obba rivulosa]|uniref:RNA helicase n=1 Tax=Obba rivulosa TaxID=1052685 RepID=A0A8E2B022_9APHY|nr:P-loop containing nucleoside triphosphate hydrolase protein [Obba rivulosa]